MFDIRVSFTLMTIQGPCSSFTGQCSLVPQPVLTGETATHDQSSGQKGPGDGSLYSDHLAHPENTDAYKVIAAMFVLLICQHNRTILVSFIGMTMTFPFRRLYIVHCYKPVSKFVTLWMLPRCKNFRFPTILSQYWHKIFLESLLWVTQMILLKKDNVCLY